MKYNLLFSYCISSQFFLCIFYLGFHKNKKKLTENMPDIMCRNALMIFHDYILDLGSLIDLITELQFDKYQSKEKIKSFCISFNDLMIKKGQINSMFRLFLVSFKGILYVLC